MEKELQSPMLFCLRASGVRDCTLLRKRVASLEFVTYISLYLFAPLSIQPQNSCLNSIYAQNNKMRSPPRKVLTDGWWRWLLSLLNVSTEVDGKRLRKIILKAIVEDDGHCPPRKRMVSRAIFLARLLEFFWIDACRSLSNATVEVDRDFFLHESDGCV